MNKYKVGDTVILFRVGKIIAIHDNEPYPIEVEFEGGSGIPAFDIKFQFREVRLNEAVQAVLRCVRSVSIP